MPQNAADHNTLSSKQILALGALLEGKTVTESALAAGADRSTVHRWQKDANFVAALNGSRRELRAAHEARVLALGEQAVIALDTAIRSGDVRAAIAVAKGTGLLSGRPPSIGSDDPEVIAKQRAQDELWDQLMSELI